jgi:hypothetical protein
MTVVRSPTLLGGNMQTIPIPVSFRHLRQAEDTGLWLDAEERPRASNQEGEREQYQERKILYIYHYRAHALQSVF